MNRNFNDLNDIDFIEVDCPVVVPIRFNVPSDDIIIGMTDLDITSISQDDLKFLILNLMSDYEVQIDDDFSKCTIEPYSNKDIEIRKENQCIKIRLKKDVLTDWQMKAQFTIPDCKLDNLKGGENSMSFVDLRKLQEYEVIWHGFINLTVRWGMKYVRNQNSSIHINPTLRDVYEFLVEQSLIDGYKIISKTLIGAYIPQDNLSEMILTEIKKPLTNLRIEKFEQAKYNQEKLRKDSSNHKKKKSDEN